MNGNVLFEIKDLQKKFGSLTVFDGLRETICKGDVVVIIGPSGGGKSTFIRCLNLLEQTTAGKIYFEGEDITAKGFDVNKHRQKVGMVFQQFNLFNNLTVLENITISLTKVKKQSEEESKEKAIKLLKRVGLEDKANAYPSQLSGGQKQRVAIAGVLAMKPDCIVLDEPTAMLDPKGRKEVMDTIHELNKKEGITIVLITHFMEEAVTADHILVIDKGVLKMEGTPREIFSQADKVTEIGLDVPVPADLARRLRKKGMAVSEKCMTDEELGEALCPFVSKM